MANGANGAAISRRRLLQGSGLAVIAAVGTEVAAMPRAELSSWDIFTDVLVLGAGAAGICAALEARAAEASVLLCEALPLPGGGSARSGGVIYAGGGTALQRALGVDDSPEAMYRFLSLAAPETPQHKLQRYCEDSAAHFDWLVQQGVPYAGGLSNKRRPMADASLYFSGNETAANYQTLAPAVPRGHIPSGSDGGQALMQALLQRAREAGVELRTGTSAQRLVVERDGRVSGALLQREGQVVAVRARLGVVLACGGFIHNREMLKVHAPKLYRCSAPWGGPGDTGSGNNMGVGVGAASLQMQQGIVLSALEPDDPALAGVVVNASGQRFIAEDASPGELGHAISFRQQGRAWLITDQRGSFAEPEDRFPVLARANSIGSLAQELAFPKGALQNTVAYYNRHAVNREDPLFNKGQDWLRPLQGPPYTAWDLSPESAFTAAHTLGGLRTTVEGAVLDSFGEQIPGLYAAGRTSAGLAVAPYPAEGVSLADCTYFGRMAGRNAAGH